MSTDSRGGQTVAETTAEQRARWVTETRALVWAMLPFLTERAVRLTLAHLALESGFGVSRAARRGNNLGNITAGPAWTGERWTDVGGDVDAKGQPITQTWRIYPSVSEFLVDYWRFLGPASNSGRYALARNALERGDFDAFPRLLYSAGYYTLAPAEYTRRLHGALDAVVACLAPPAVPPVTGGGT